MFVLEVIPLSRTAPPEPLSYRSRTRLAPGTIVQVPLRKKTVPGLVIECVPVQEAKAMIKSASFSLSKSSDEKQGQLPRALITAAEKIATYHATTLGAVLSALLVPVMPNELPGRFSKGSGFLIDHVEKNFLDRVAVYMKYIHMDDSERSAATKDANRGDNSGVTLLVVPTLTEASEFAELFKKLKPIVLTSRIPMKKRDEMIARAAGARSGLIIATSGFATIPATHLSRVIIERTSAGSYVLPRRPYLDLRMALTALCEARDIPITYGDFPLPIEYRAKPSASLGEEPSGKIQIFDARRAEGDETQFEAIPLKIRAEIAKVLEKGGRVAVLAVRRGYAPAVVCRDCGTTVTDEYGRTLSLSITAGRSGNERIFRSADGKTIEGTKVLCKHCEGWNLLPLGVGIERIEEELKKAFPDAPLIRIDADSNSARALVTTRAAINKSGTIIIGTELMLPWLSAAAPVELSVIASADSLLAMPFWRARERFARVGLMLAERSTRLIVSTRKPDDEVFTALTSPTTSTFWKDESELRKLLFYPPYGTLISFHVEGGQLQIEKAREQVKEAVAPNSLLELPLRAVAKNVFHGTSVVHIKSEQWPSKSLATKLARLSPGIKVTINAESFW